MFFVEALGGNAGNCRYKARTSGSIWLRSCLIASLAVSSLPAVAADAAVEATREADALKSAPAVVNDIPVQKAAGSIVVDASGRLRSFMKRDSKVDERTLPSTSGIQSRERALEALGDQLHMELAYDDEQELYQYQAFPYGWVDAKTGEAAAPPYKYDDTSLTVGSANRKQPTALTADEAKTMAHDFFGVSPDQLKTSSRRESHPNEAPLSIYTLQDDRRSIVVRTDEKTGALLQADLLRSQSSPSRLIRMKAS